MQNLAVRSCALGNETHLATGRFRVRLKRKIRERALEDQRHHFDRFLSSRAYFLKSKKESALIITVSEMGNQWVSKP